MSDQTLGPAAVQHEGVAGTKAALATALAAAIRRRGLTQAEAARLCRTDQPTLCKVLRGRSGVASLDRLVAWLAALGCPVHVSVGEPGDGCGAITVHCPDGDDGARPVPPGAAPDVTPGLPAGGERRLAEAERERARLGAVIDGIAEAVVAVFPRENVWLRNPAWLALHGFASFDELPGREVWSFERLFDIRHPDGRPVARTDLPIARVLRGESFADVEVRLRRTDREHERWVSYNGAARRDPDGTVTLAVLTMRDITARTRAETALRASEARLRELADAMPQLVWGADAAGRIDYYSARRAEFAALLPGGNALDWRPFVHPDDKEPTAAAWRKASGAGAPYEMEHRLRMADGGYRWHVSRAVPVRDEAGRVARWYGTATDIDALKRAEAALRASEERLRLALGAARMFCWDWDVGTGRMEWSEGLEAACGLPPGGFAGTLEAFRALVDPEDLPRVDAALARALAGGEGYEAEFRLKRGDDGAARWVVARGAVLRDAAGRPARVVGVDLDITERKEAEARRELLLGELSHRVKNTLAVIQAIARQTGRGAASLPAFLDAFAGRLDALAAAHELLTASGWAGVGLDALVQRALAPHAAEGQAEVAVRDGPVPAGLAQDLALALHELGTNAAKHGALSVPGGRVTVEGGVVGEGMGGEVRLSWREAGGPLVAGPPQRQGFGTTLLSRTLSYGRDGAVELDWRPEGLACRIRLRLARADDKRAAA